MNKKAIGFSLIIIGLAIALWYFQNRIVMSVSEVSASTSKSGRVSFASITAAVTPPAKSDVQKTDESIVATPDLTDEGIFCKVLEAQPGVVVTGEIKIWVWSYSVDDEGQPGMVAMIHSSDCPENTFSKVRIDDQGRTKEFIDCRNTNLEELALQAGVQGNILDQTDSIDKVHLAISGGGYFVTRCEDGFYLTRNGDFQKSSEQLTQNGCVLQAADGSPFQTNGDVDENGCRSDGVCLAIVHPENAQTVSFTESGALRALANPFLHPIKNPRVFRNALESDAKSKVPGPDWEATPEFKLPDCAKIRAQPRAN